MSQALCLCTFCWSSYSQCSLFCLQANSHSRNLLMFVFNLAVTTLAACRRDPRLDSFPESTGPSMSSQYVASSEGSKRQRMDATPNCTIYIPNPSLVGAQVFDLLLICFGKPAVSTAAFCFAHAVHDHQTKSAVSSIMTVVHSPICFHLDMIMFRSILLSASGEAYACLELAVLQQCPSVCLSASFMT